MVNLIMMVGIVASGKSYYAEKIAIEGNMIILSSDSLREELYGDANNQENNGELFIELHRRVKENLIQGKNVIIDSTNISSKKRMAFLQELNKIPCEKICCFIATPYEKCLEQNNKRDRKVPEYVIRRMYENICIPQMHEGWNEIDIINNFNKEDYNLDNLLLELDSIPQDNPFHTLSIGGHCRKCQEVLDTIIKDDIFSITALLHDVGKGFCKTFKNSKGEITDIAHYYSHENVSAYMSLFYSSSCQDYQLEVANLIQLHMRLFQETEKSKKKLINLIGEQTYNNLLILHEADLQAK